MSTLLPNVKLQPGVGAVDISNGLQGQQVLVRNQTSHEVVVHFGPVPPQPGEGMILGRLQEMTDFISSRVWVRAPSNATGEMYVNRTSVGRTRVELADEAAFNALTNKDPNVDYWWPVT